MATKKKKAEAPAAGTPKPEAAAPAAGTLTQAKQALSPDKNTAAAAPVVTEPLGALVDELGQIDKDLAPLAGKIARQKKLRSDLREKTPDSQSEVHGELFVAVLGPHGKKTVVDYAGVAKKIGYQAYAAFATATLEALYENVKPGILALFTRTELTGPRSIDIQEKGQPAQP